MQFNLATFAVIVLCTSLASKGVANDDVSPVDVANKFVDALQHRHFKDAATMFAPEVTRDTIADELYMKRIDDTLGSFSTMHPLTRLANGRTIKLEVPAHSNFFSKAQKFIQIRYASTASDGQPVFYEVDLTANNKQLQVLSFVLHFPASDEQSTKRATQLVSAINRDGHRGKP